MSSSSIDLGTNAGALVSPIDLTTSVTSTLPPANGGTGSGTAYAAGHIIYTGASGLYKASGESTGSGTASLSTNCPATTATAPYTWISVKSSDGSTVYIPAWK